MSLVQIVGGTVFDAIHGEVIRNGVVCIENDRITAVGPASTIATGGRDAQVIDAAGQFVMPGMIDCHVHLLSSGAADYATRGLKELLPYTAIRGAANAKIMLDMGFTTVRDVGAMGYGNIALRQAIEDGLVPGPRIYAAGHSLSVPGGHGDSYFRPEVHVERNGLINGPEAARWAVRELIKMRADVIKLLVTGGVMTDGSDVGVLRVGARRVAGGDLTGSSTGPSRRRALSRCGGCEGGDQGGPGHGRAWHLARRRSHRSNARTWHALYPHDGGAFPYLRRRHGQRHPSICGAEIAPGDGAHESVRQAHEVGVKIAMGTDCGTPFNVAGKNALELELLTQNGLSTAEALMATTRVAADAIGISSMRARSEPAGGLTSSWCRGTHSRISACYRKLSTSPA